MIQTNTGEQAPRGRTPRISPEGTKQRDLMVRMPAAIHTALVERRKTTGKSLNQFAVDALVEALKHDDRTEPTTNAPQN
jgi:predicted HicB family RNase H-like nuclease